MKDILIHYGVKGMKWGVRKQYEGTGGGGGGGWGPNTIATGGGPSPLAASMAGNPKKKTSFGKSEADKMGVKDKKKEIAARRKETKKMSKRLNDLSTEISLNSYVYEDRAKGSKREQKLMEQINNNRNKAFKEVDSILAECERKGYSVSYITTTTEWTNGVDYVTNLPVVRFDVTDYEK